VGNLNDRRECRNPYSGLLAFAGAQNFVAHTLRANLECEHLLDGALEFHAQLS
jgi:hypothetical protein